MTVLSSIGSFIGNLFAHMPEKSGLWALFALLPVIVLYLIRPRPRRETVPALMFLYREIGRSTKYSFLRVLMRSMLLVLQILTIIAIAVALTKPFVDIPQSAFVSQRTAIVLDVSASSATRHGSGTRLDYAIGLAKQSIGDRTTIVLASQTPEVIVEQGNRQQALSALRGLETKETETNLYDAIITAGQALAGQDGSIVIISDFIDSASVTDYDTAIKTLESQGLTVIKKSTWNEADNVGIIDLDIGPERTAVIIKNFGNQPKDLAVQAAGVRKNMRINSRNIDAFVFPTQQGSTLVELLVDDDLSLDNKAWTMRPIPAQTKVLFITSQENSHLMTALSLLQGIEMEIAYPPSVPDVHHDLLVFHNVRQDLLLPGTMSKIAEGVATGTDIIIAAQPDTRDFYFYGLTPFQIAGEGNITSVIGAESNKLTKDVDFGDVRKHFIIQGMPEDAEVIARTADNNPIIMQYNHGEGRVFFFGIIDQESDFKIALYYPIFWKRVINHLTNTPTEAEVNLFTGNILRFDYDTDVTLPDNTVQKTSILSLDQVGIYKYPGRELVANLLSERESDVSRIDEQNDAIVNQGRNNGESTMPMDVTNHAIVIVAILMFLEILFVKMRGDL